MNQRDTLHVAFYTGGASLDILGGSPTQASALHSEAKICTQTAHTSAFSSAHLVLTVIAAHLGGDDQYCWAPAAYINEKVEQVLGCSVSRPSLCAIVLPTLSDLPSWRQHYPQRSLLTCRTSSQTRSPT